MLQIKLQFLHPEKFQAPKVDGNQMMRSKDNL